MTCKPLCDNLCYGDTCNLGTHTEDGKTECCKEYLSRVAEELCCAEVAVYGIPLDKCTYKHQAATHYTCEANAALVEDDTSEEEHQKEYVDVTISSREEAVVITCPAQATLGRALGEKILQRSHHVGDEVTAHHRERHDDKRQPTSCRRVV